MRLMKPSFSIYILFVSFYSWAQDGAIKGVVKENGNPVEFANVFLTLQQDTAKIITGTVTDNLGKFSLEKLPVQNYQLHVQMIGYLTKKLNVAITSSNQQINLNEIAIETDVLLLKSVEVTAMRDIIKKTEEGFVVNAADNLTQIGGTAADLLRNMPGILVGSEGEITIRGKTPLTYINGRISGITGVDRAAQLDRIPASSIERIEVINNPSSKYDADAEGGVINIILKKNQDVGTNGAFALGAGLGSRYRLNGSLLLNHKAGAWNVGFAYDNWYTTRTRRISGDRVNYDIPDQYYLTQRRFDERLIFYQNAKTTIDYTPNKKNSFSFEALWAFPGEDNRETLNNTHESSNQNFNDRNQRYSQEIRRSHAIELALNYVKKFNDPDKQLSVNLSNTFEKEKENTDITTQYLTEQDVEIGSSFLQRTHVYQNTNLASAAIDYSQALSQHADFETGYKGISRMLNSDFERSNFTNGDYVIDPLNTNVFDFKEQIHAAYAQYISWTGDKQDPVWKYNFGLRAEQVWNHGETINESDKFDNNYFKLYPSANLFYYTPKKDNFKLSYSRRINRPGLGQLNPFIDITDSLNQHGGNSHLKPELIHSLELGYNHAISKGSLSLATFYRLKNNAILQYIILDNNGVALSQPRNFGNASTVGMEAIATYNPFSFWSLNFSFSAYELRIYNSGDAIDISNNQLSWYSKLINNFTLWKDARLQVAANYTSPVAIPQGTTFAIYNVDLGFQQKVMKGKGRLGFSFTDIFNTQRSGATTSDFNFEATRKSKLDTRAIMLTFGYTFNSTFKEKLMENKFRND
jgi:outer membrane receptor protein involved in Fe transport